MSDTDDTTSTPLPDEWDDLLDSVDSLGPATDDQGRPGHDLARAAARRAQAVRLRLAGATYEQIARETGYADKSNARKAVMRALTAVEAHSVAELRLLENARLEQDELVLRTIIGDSAQTPLTRMRAITTRTHLSARRARLNGLDAPVQVALSAGVASDLADALAEAEAVLLRGGVFKITDAGDERLEG